MSPWAVKRLDEFGGDISKFTVVQAAPLASCARSASPRPSRATRTTRTSPRSSARSISASSRFFSQNDADAYSYSGGLNRTTQGILEFVEMFKAPIKMLHPLLTATQEGNYIGSENIGAMPFQGIILAHSNEAEWQSFKQQPNNEAFIDRICVIKVPYCLRVTEEQQIYEKLLQGSELQDAAVAPGTLDMLARFCVLSRLKPHENSNLYSKMRVYDGESLKDTDPHAKTMQEYRDAAGVDEGMDGHLDPLRLQDPVGDLQLRHARGRGRPRAPDVRARAGDPPRAVARGDREAAISSSSRRSWRRAMPSSSATRSRRPIWNPTAITARTCSTATSPMPTPGSRTRTSRTPTPAS